MVLTCAGDMWGKPLETRACYLIIDTFYFYLRALLSYCIMNRKGKTHLTAVVLVVHTVCFIIYKDHNKDSKRRETWQESNGLMRF